VLRAICEQATRQQWRNDKKTVGVAQPEPMKTASSIVGRIIGSVAAIMVGVGWIFYFLIATGSYAPTDSALLLLLLLGVVAVIASVLAWIDRLRWLLVTLGAVLMLVGLVAVALAS
jgi:hypothetical protein